jgi:hypothetical protein
MPLEICAAEPRTSILVHKIFSINRISLTSCTESQRTGSSISFSLAAIRLKNATFNLRHDPAPVALSSPLTSDQMLHVPVLPKKYLSSDRAGLGQQCPYSSSAKAKDIFGSLKRVLSQADVWLLPSTNRK